MLSNVISYWNTSSSGVPRSSPYADPSSQSIEGLPLGSRVGTVEGGTVGISEGDFEG